METEAMRIAKEWADSTGNMGFICRAFLAQQARLAEVERDLNTFRDGYWSLADELKEACGIRPAPTPEPEPEPLKVKVRTDYGYVLHVAGRDAYIDLTPEDCRRIVALGSRPTQTAEGK